jgi:hypothetical protein
MRIPNRRRLSLAALVTVAAVSSAAPAQADAGDVCDVRLDRLEAQFYDMADRRGYEEASDWWQDRWSAYHRSCILN